jgi:hypothetical protein
VPLIGWLDPETDLGDWMDAPEDDLELRSFLETAYEKLLDWAPEPVPTGLLLDEDGETVLDPVPARYKYAQRLLAQHLAARKRAGDGEGFGSDGFMISTYPLVREAYEAVRPRRSPLKGLL